MSTGPHMAEHCETTDAMISPRFALNRSYFAHQALISTQLLCCAGTCSAAWWWLNCRFCCNMTGVIVSNPWSTTVPWSDGTHSKNHCRPWLVSLLRYSWPASKGNAVRTRLAFSRHSLLSIDLPLPRSCGPIASMTWHHYMRTADFKELAMVLEHVTMDLPLWIVIFVYTKSRMLPFRDKLFSKLTYQAYHDVLITRCLGSWVNRNIRISSRGHVFIYSHERAALSHIYL